MEEVMADIRREGDPAFPEDTENDNSASSPEEETNIEETDTSNQDKQEDDKQEEGKEEETPDDKPDRGFADHPRFKELINEKNELKKKLNEQSDEFAKLREEVEAKIENTKSSETQPASEPVPTYFNGDEEAYRAFSKDLDARISKAREEAKAETLRELDNKTSSEKKAIEDAKVYFQSQVDEIESDSGEKVDPNKLLKTVLDNDLTDSKGRWNYKAGWRLLKASKAPVKKENKERKEIAGVTTSNNRAEKKPSPYATSKDFKGKSWDDMKKWD